MCVAIRFFLYLANESFENVKLTVCFLKDATDIFHWILELLFIGVECRRFNQLFSAHFFFVNFFFSPPSSGIRSGSGTYIFLRKPSHIHQSSTYFMKYMHIFLSRRRCMIAAVVTSNKFKYPVIYFVFTL